MVMRISGHLNVDALKVAASGLLRRHAALRTRIKLIDGSPMQEVLGSCEQPLSFHDTGDPETSEARVDPEAAISGLIPYDIDICREPLFGMHLLALRDDEYILTIHMEHIISDGWSMGIVWKDLFDLYESAIGNEQTSPRKQPLQFADYAARQGDSGNPWLGIHRSHWQTHFNGCARVPFPVDRRLSLHDRSGWDVTRFQVPARVMVAVAEWSRRRCTTTVMAVFTAYVAFVLRWCDVSEMVVLFQTEGRSSPDAEEAVGYFAFPLYLRVGLAAGDDFLALKGRIVEEYVLASEHADHSWLESCGFGGDYVRNTRFNWLPDSREIVKVGRGLTGSVMPEVEDAVHRRSLMHLQRDTEPMMGIIARDGDIEGEWLYPKSRFSSETMTRFVEGFLRFLDILVAHPEKEVRSIPVNR
jgi:hypothetical protein